MPTYAYKCQQDHYVEEQRGFDEPQSVHECPECGNTLKKVFTVPTFNLVGRGFYSNGG